MKQIDTKKLLNDLKIKLSNELNETQIIEIRNSFVNKYLSPIYDELKLASLSDKKVIGNFVNLFKNDVNNLVEEVLIKFRQENENKVHEVNYDLNIDNVNFVKGGLTPITLMTNKVIAFFKSLDFQILTGEEITSTKYNFDNLNIDINHPARSYQDSFFINSTMMLRTHCTSVTAQALENNKSKDIRVITFGNVYRNDEDDATHSHQFNQVDIV
jgi:phenylalanyl-tRNA synthetase alpha chain